MGTADAEKGARMEGEGLDVETRAYLRELTRGRLFWAVGSEGGEVRSWDEAVARDDVAWENFRLEKQNELSMSLLAHSQALLNTWNRCVVAATPVINAYVEAELMRYQVAAAWAVKSSVRWDLLSAVAEHQYRHYTTMRFHRVIAQAYREGRFPCGWEGPIDGGKAVVY